jgi:hypothetical protein
LVTIDEGRLDSVIGKCGDQPTCLAAAGSDAVMAYRMMALSTSSEPIARGFQNMAERFHGDAGQNPPTDLTGETVGEVLARV